MMQPYVVYVLLGSFFGWWLIHTLLERFCGMGAKILPQETIDHMDREIEAKYQNLSEEQTKKTPYVSNIMRRSTRAMDPEGKYRIQSRPSLQFTKAVFAFSVAMVCLVQLLLPNGFQVYVAHLYDLDPSTARLPLFQLAAVLTLSWYLFEMAMLSQYYKIQWSVMYHHWLTALVTALMLGGHFLPAVNWYGIWIIAGPFPVNIYMGFRMQYGHRYPELTRRLAPIVANYYMLLLLVCLTGQALLITNATLRGFYGPLGVVITVLSCIVWCFDDLKFIDAVRQGRFRNYEDVVFAPQTTTEKDQQTTTPQPSQGGLTTPAFAPKESVQEPTMEALKKACTVQHTQELVFQNIKS